MTDPDGVLTEEQLLAMREHVQSASIEDDWLPRLWLEQARKCGCPPCRRIVSDYERHRD